jgi:hypothetical protein
LAAFVPGAPPVPLTAAPEDSELPPPLPPVEELKNYPEDAEIDVATDCHGCLEEADHVRIDKRGMVVIESGPLRP